MTRIEIEVPDELASRYDELARSAGQSADEFIRETLIEHLEDLQDMAVARERLASPGRSISLKELKKNLGLDD